VIQPANREIRKEPVARAVVSVVEATRAFLVATPLWTLLTWIILAVLGMAEQVIHVTGRKDWLYEVDSIRGFWQPGQRRGHLKKIQ
jgi:ABC-type antimicrobial peptide transport system permease subunit